MILLKSIYLHVKLEIKSIQTSIKGKFYKQSVVILFKNGCSVTHMFYKITVPLSVAKAIQKHIGSSLYLAFVYFNKISHSHGKFTERLFPVQLLCTKFFRGDIFQNSYFYLVIKKTKFINEN